MKPHFRTFTLILTLMVVAACLSTPQNNTPTTTTTIPPNGEVVVGDITPQTGDVVSIDYTIRVQHMVMDSTIQEVAQESKDWELIRSIRPFGFEPYTFIVGSGHINREFNDVVSEMRVGESKTIVLPEERSIAGPRRSSMVETVERVTKIPLLDVVPTPLFKSYYGTEPVEGEELNLQYWNSSVIEVTSEITKVQHKPENNSHIETPGGNITIVIEDQTILMTFNPLINTTSITQDGRFVTITEANDTHMTVDYNHPLAGKELELEIKLLKISNPIQYLTNIDEAMHIAEKSNTPLVILFTNASCVTCRRIEKEILTHPLPLALKDRFTWALIDTDIQKETAQRFEVKNLPTTLILKNNKEINRINTFLTPSQMRAELEKALQNS